MCKVRRWRNEYLFIIFGKKIELIKVFMREIVEEL